MPASAALGTWWTGMGLAALVALAGCASPPPAPPMLHLPSALGTADAPSDSAAASSAAPAPADWQQDWRLVTPVRVPAAVDRDAVMVASADGQWTTWRGLRWSEPLQDAVPRVLAADLSRLRGAPVWQGRAVPGVAAARELRIDIDDWETSAPRAQVRLRAHWTLTSPAGQVPPWRGSAEVVQPWPQATPEGLVAAQRAALRALAVQMLAQWTARPADGLAAPNGPAPATRAP